MATPQSLPSTPSTNRTVSLPPTPLAVRSRLRCVREMDQEGGFLGLVPPPRATTDWNAMSSQFSTRVHSMPVDRLMEGSGLKALVDRFSGSPTQVSGSATDNMQASAEEWHKLGEEFFNSMHRMISQKPDIIIKEPPYELPDNQFAVLKLISLDITWIFELSPDDRNVLERLIERFDTWGFIGMNNLDHASLANNFALIMVRGRHIAMKNPRLQNAYSRWMNADPEVTLTAFYEYCYLPVRQSIQAAELDNNYKASLLADWHLFASMGVRDWPHLHPKAWKQVLPPQFMLNPRKMLHRHLRVQGQKLAAAQGNTHTPLPIAPFTEQYENWKPDKDHISFRDPQDEPQFYNPFMSHLSYEDMPPAKSIEERVEELEYTAKSLIAQKRQEEQEAEADLFKRAFKTTHPAVRYDANPGGVHQFWGHPGPKRNGEELSKEFKPAFTHKDCNCDACTELFGMLDESAMEE